MAKLGYGTRPKEKVWARLTPLGSGDFYQQKLYTTRYRQLRQLLY